MFEYEFYLFWLNKSFNSHWSSKRFDIKRKFIFSSSSITIDRNDHFSQWFPRQENRSVKRVKKMRVNLIVKRMFINHRNTIPIVICLQSIVVCFIVSDHKWCYYSHTHTHTHTVLIDIKVSSLHQLSFLHVLLASYVFIPLLKILHINASNETRINWFKACSFLIHLFFFACA